MKRRPAAAPCPAMREGTAVSALLAGLALAAALACTLPRATHAATHAAAPDPLRELIDQGKYWQAHGRGDLAVQAWEKVLHARPDDADALFGMGLVMADRENTVAARQYLDRLRRVAPNYPSIDDLAQRLGQTGPHQQAIDNARHLAQTGQNASAAQAFRNAFGGQPATPELRLEYYQALSATPNGWDEARRGLAELARENANDPRYALAYAQHLTYRDTTRREGIAQLRRLTSDSKVGAQARASWRQALLWLAARPADQPLFDAWLALVPDDPAVRARYESMVKEGAREHQQSQQNAANDAHGRALGEGFAALDRNDTATARARFAAVLASTPNDSDALGGMGIVELKEAHFEAARTDLERASRSGSPARWREALASANYWALTSEALGAQSNGDFARAKSLFERAIALNPSDVTAQVMLGQGLLDNHDAQGAEQAFRMALRRQADNPDAIRGLIGALAAQGRGDEALQFATQLTAEQQAKAGGLDRLRGTAEAAQAREAEARGDLGRARSLFEDALISSPDDPWMRLDLARIYVRQGATGQARSMMDGLIATHPQMVDALYAGALLAEQTKDWGRGLELLDRIPAAQRKADMERLQHRLWVGQQVDLAAQLAKHGQTQQALATLGNAESLAMQTPALVGELAGGYVTAGDPGRALWLVQNALRSAPGDPDLQLQYAGILFASHADAELGDVMRRLSATQLTPSQRTDFERLNLMIVVRQADAVRMSGDLASAYDVIAPWLAAMPDDPDLQAALARLYGSAGDPAHALKAYRVALARRPDDLGLQVAAIYAASGAREWDFAGQTASAALAAAPDDPALLAAVGRMYRAKGNLSLAGQYLQRSLAASTTPPGARFPPAAATDAAPANVPRGWEALARPIGANPPPGTNPFEGKKAVDVSEAAPAGAARYGAPASAGSLWSHLSSALTTVPTALPPAPPAPYVTPYVAPAGAASGYQPLPAAPYAPQTYAAPPPYIPQPPAGYAQAYPPPESSAAPTPQQTASEQTLTVAGELAQINREESSTVSGGIVFRNRTGEDGLSNLTDIEAPVQGRIRAGNGHIVVTATPVTLDAGTAANDLPTLARFGSGLSNSPTGSHPGAQTASGVGLSIGYETASVKGDIGTTPVGFRNQDVVGGLEYDGGITDKASYSLAVTRRAVTDSLLSYAGARDAEAGLEWGSVVKTGARAAFGWDDGTSGVYANAQFQYYDGRHVENNYEGKGGGGAYTRLYKGEDATLTVGMNATWMSFSKNQSYFTYGQGGYFSPQQYVILNFPVEYAGRDGPFTFDLKGSVGVQHYREDAVAYFPLDPARQASASANMNAATGVSLDGDATYPSQSRSGFSYSLYADGEYQLAPQLAVGAMASIGNAYQYREWLAAVYIRYSFTPQTGAQPFPPKPLVSPYLANLDD